jgi:hypothetical protein
VQDVLQVTNSEPLRSILDAAVRRDGNYFLTDLASYLGGKFVVFD